MLDHIRIETRTPRTAGLPTVAARDRIVFVTDAGEHVDITAVVTSWGTSNNPGEVRGLTLNVDRFHVHEVPYSEYGQPSRFDLPTVAA